MKQREERKKNPVVGIVIAAFVLLSVLMDEVPGEIVGVIFVLLFAVVFAAAAVSVVRASAKKKSQERHSHDRIDHSRDLQINPQTGKAANRPVTLAGQHSAREHWKRQLDDLLANGTIDKDEYRVMMNRKF